MLKTVIFELTDTWTFLGRDHPLTPHVSFVFCRTEDGANSSSRQLIDLHFTLYRVMQ